MQVWKYNDKCYLREMIKKVIEYRVDSSNVISEGKIELFSFYKRYALHYGSNVS